MCGVKTARDLVRSRQTVSACFSPRGREFVVAAVAVGGVFGGVVCAEDHGAEGGETGGDDGDGCFDHGDGAC